MRNLRRKFAPRPNIVLASFKFYPPPPPPFLYPNPPYSALVRC